MQSGASVLGRRQRVCFAHLSDDPDVEPRLQALEHFPGESGIGQLGVVNQQLLSRTCDERGEPLACIFRADNESIAAWRVPLSSRIGLEELEGFIDQTA